MVFQMFYLFPHLTAAENVMLGLRKVRGKSKAEARAIAERWLTRVGLAEKFDSYPAQLSGGQQQRVGIARAVAMEPKVLLLDEITSALDPELVGEVLAVVRQLADDGMTMIVVTHEMAFAREVSDLVVFMDGGRIVVAGRPDEVLQNPSHERLKTFLSRLDSNRGPKRRVLDQLPHPRSSPMPSNRPDIRPQLGLRRIINVSGTMTSLGASIVVPEAVQMAEGILSEFVEINELHRRACATIAQATGAEAGCITASCSAGITIAVAGCMTGADLARIEQLPDAAGMKDEVLIQAGHMVYYGAPIEQALRLTGAKVVPVGQSTFARPYHLAGKINERTAAAVYRDFPSCRAVWPDRSGGILRHLQGARRACHRRRGVGVRSARASSPRVPISSAIARTNSWAGRPPASSPGARTWCARHSCRTTASAAA